MGDQKALDGMRIVIDPGLRNIHLFQQKETYSLGLQFADMVQEKPPGTAVQRKSELG